MGHVLPGGLSLWADHEVKAVVVSVEPTRVPDDRCLEVEYQWVNSPSAKNFHTE